MFFVYYLILMTTFSETDHPRVFEVRTFFDRHTATTVQTIQHLGFASLNQAMINIMKVEQYYQEIVQDGGMLLGQLNNTVSHLYPYEVYPPKEGYKDDELVPAAFRIGEPLKDYLEPYTNPDNPHDLVTSWHGNIDFYSNLYEHRILGGTFHQLRPDARQPRISTINFLDPLLGPPAQKGKNWLNKLSWRKDGI